MTGPEQLQSKTAHRGRHFGSVVNTLGSQLKSTFTNVSSQLATAGK
jgi:hypothetical protein